MQAIVDTEVPKLYRHMLTCIDPPTSPLFPPQEAYIYDLDKQLPAPVHLLQGYPFSYGPALKGGAVPAVACYALLLRSSALGLLKASFSLPADLGPEYTCVDVSLRLQEQGSQVRGPCMAAQQLGSTMPAAGCPGQPAAAFTSSDIADSRSSTLDSSCSMLSVVVALLLTLPANLLATCCRS